MNIFEQELNKSLDHVKLHMLMNDVLSSVLAEESVTFNLFDLFEDHLRQNGIIVEGILDYIKSKLNRTLTADDIKKYYARMSPENQQALRSEISGGDRQKRLTKELAIITLNVKDIFKRELENLSNKLYNSQDENTTRGRNTRQVIAALYSKLKPGIDKWQPTLHTGQGKAFDPKSAGLGAKPDYQI